MEYIRNLSIIAHVDHGKSTLADRFIQYCGALTDREMSAQVLDSMDLERERGITIKAQSVTLRYPAKDGKKYQLNIIDTPGHVDFSYEVSRSLTACEGALLIVDAVQGVEAQSIANYFIALESGLEIIPVLNKIDLSAAEPERITREIGEVMDSNIKEIACVSAKTGAGVEGLLEQLISKIPSPSGEKTAPLAALIIDSWFDNYLGVVSLVRIMDGVLKVGEKIKVMSTKREYLVDEVGQFTPRRSKKKYLVAGEIGYVIAGIKEINGAPVGDTLTTAVASVADPLPGFQAVKPRVFAGLFPADSADYESFRSALAKLRLNDAALQYEPEVSQALGFGFRCGFLGMLHLEIIQERLEREYGLALITTAPTVIYQVVTTDKKTITIDNPADLPSLDKIVEIREPIIQASILVPQDYLGNVLSLCIKRRGVQKKLHYLSKQVSLLFEMPMSEVALNFFDQLKSVSRGFASFDYTFLRFQPTRIVRLDILINHERVDALSSIIYYDQAQRKGRELAEKMKELIPRQMYEVAIQAAIGTKIVARSTVKAFRKNVTAKCYGGDITRKRKLLEKQKKGKKRIKQFGSIEIPQSAFMAVLDVGDVG